MEPLPSVTKIYSLLHQEEKQQEINSSTPPLPDAAALIAKPMSRGNSFQRGASSNRGNSSQRGASSNRRIRPHCNHCGRDGHSRDRCYKLVGYPTRPPASPSRSGDNALLTQSPVNLPPFTPDQYNQLLAMLSTSSNSSSAHLAGIALTVPSHSVWIVDTGATNHMCSTLSLFSSYTACSHPSSVQLPDGSNAIVTHIGIVHLSPSITLEHVLFIPSFKFNLLSVHHLAPSTSCSVIFSSTRCIFQDLSTRKSIGQGDAHEGLYYFHATTALVVLHPPSLDPWHFRLGHLNYQSP